MALLARSNWPSLLQEPLLADIFDEERFFNFPFMTGRRIPAVNIRETDRTYEVELAAPGYNKQDFNIAVENGVLTVSAQKRDEKESKENNYTRREFGFYSFSRSFNLPANTTEEDVKARYEDGILKLTINRKDTAKKESKKVIEVK